MATQWVAYVRKGLVAVGGGLAIAATALTPYSDGGTTVTAAEWTLIALGALSAVGVYVVPNGPRPGSGVG